MEKLARTLGLECAFVGELIERSPETVRTVAWWKDGRQRDNVEYPVFGTACGPAIRGRSACYPRNVPQLFPHVTFYQAEGTQAYAAYPLTSLSGERLGLVAVTSRAPFADPHLVRRALRVVAPRASGEIERVRLEAARRTDHETVLRGVHHRIKNDLQILASLLAMQAGASGDPTIARLLSEARTRISTVALFHTEFCQGPDGSSVDMNRLVEGLVQNVCQAFADVATGITVAVDLAPLTLPIRWATPCGLLISEMLTNAFKHAFAGVPAGRIDVRLAVQGGDITIVVRDDGRGLPNAVEQTEGMGIGLPLIRLLATRQLRGVLTIDRTRGTALTVRFSQANGLATA